jgi:hypothetical protein
MEDVEMKKLLVLFVVLGLATVATAGVVDIKITSLNGVAIAPVSEITIKPSDIVDLTITYDSTTNLFLFGLSAFVNVDKQNLGELSLASVVRNAAMDGTLEAKGEIGGQQWIVEAASMAGVPAVTGQSQPVVTNLLLHCLGEGVVKIWLSDYAPGGGSLEVTSDFGTTVIPTYGAGVTIAQIPEPMTLMLLGLGSLFLARRKK